MANNRIKGITIAIGGDTTGLDKALKSTDQSLRSTQQQLKDVDRLLKFDPKNITLLEQRQRLLSEAVEETGDRLQTLQEAEKQVQKQFERGEVSREQYEALQREIVSASADLKRLEAEAADANRQLGKIDEDPLEDVEQAAEEAGDALKDASKDADTFGDVLKAGSILEGVKAISGAIRELSEETKEYRKIMGTLEVSSRQAGYSQEQTAEVFRKLYGVLGDDQAAATTTANLQALNLSQQELLRLTTLTTGAWAKYGDSIPIDGLAESINETVKAGQVTGTFADVLNWGSKEGETFGVALKAATRENEAWNNAVLDAASAEDFFNLALQQCSSEAERANLILQAMARQGLGSLGNAWRENNADIVAVNEAQADFTDMTAQMAERLAPLTQSMQEGFNLLLSTLLSLTENVDVESFAGDIEGLFAALSGLMSFVVEHYEPFLAALAGIGGGIAGLKIASLVTAISQAGGAVAYLTGTFPALGAAIAALSGPVGWIAGAVTGFTALFLLSGEEIKAWLEGLDSYLQEVFVRDWTEVFGTRLGEALNGFLNTCALLWEGVKGILTGLIDFVNGVFAGDWEAALMGLYMTIEGIGGLIAGCISGIGNTFIGLLNSVIDGVNWLASRLSGINFQVPMEWGGGTFGIDLPTIPNIPYLAKGGTVFEGSAIVGEAGPELLTVGNGRAVVEPLAGNTGRIESLLGDISGLLGAPQPGQPMVVQVVLDKKVVGEAAFSYNRQRGRANG